MILTKRKLQEMQKAIDAAWASDDPDVKAAQLELFPEGRPDAATFVRRIAEYARENAVPS